MWPWRRHAPAEEPPPLPNMHYSNADACHNMQVFRNPSRVGCLALQMAINLVGISSAKNTRAAAAAPQSCKAAEKTRPLQISSLYRIRQPVRMPMGPRDLSKSDKSVGFLIAPSQSHP
jgi:hypothetical protein